MGTIDRKCSNVGTSLFSFLQKETLIWEKDIRKSSTVLRLTSFYFVIHKDVTMYYPFV